MGEDRVWSGGRIWTGRRFVRRLVAEDGRIVVADDGSGGGAAVPTGAERTDLRGRLVVPAFVDAHLHITETALGPAGIDLRGARSLAEIGERVEARAAGPPRGALWGRGWDQELLAEHRMPDRRDLDRWSRDRPMVLTRICEHVAVANSAALELLGVGPRTPDPPGGTIDRDPTGEPTGILRERALGFLGRFPYPTLADRPELGRAFLRHAARLGIAAVAGMRVSPSEWEWLSSLPSGDRDPVRPICRAFGGVSEVSEIEAWARRRRTRPSSLTGIKLFADGSFGGRGAWLAEPYADAPDGSGGPLVPPGDWEGLIRAADGLALRVAAHALGDRAVATVLNALEAVGPRERPRIEHAGLVPEALRSRMAALPVDVVVQPGFRTSDRWLGDRLGPKRLVDAYPLASMLRLGVALAGSSDAPVEALDPLAGIRAACARNGIGEVLEVRDALRLYHAGGAAALGLPGLGHLEPGAEASLIAFEADSLASLADERTSGIREVWLRGRPVAAPEAAP